MTEDKIYCPVCQCIIIAENADRVEDGLDEDYIFVHDEISHSQEDIDALAGGIN